MTRDEVLNILRQNRVEIQGFGVQALAIFGSVARNEASSGSDVDLLVEFTGEITFDRYMDLKFYLEDRLGVKVDLVTRKMLRSPIRQTVEKEAFNAT